MTEHKQPDEPTFDIDSVELEEREVKVPLFQLPTEGTPDEIYETIKQQIWNLYQEAYKTAVEEHEGVLFKHAFDKTQGILWVKAYYEEKLVYTPKVIDNDIKNLEREIKHYIRLARDKGDADEADRIWKTHKKQLIKWKRDYRKRIYRLKKMQIGSATSVYMTMPHLVKEMVEDLVRETNKRYKRIKREHDKITKYEDAVFIDLDKENVEENDE